MAKMINSVRRSNDLEKAPFVLPKSTQETIPFDSVTKDGIFIVGKNKFTATWMLSDINYMTAAEEEQEVYLEQYADLLNSLDPGVTTKITIMNTSHGQRKKEDYQLLLASDGLDELRAEYNAMLGAVTHDSAQVHQVKYLTMTAECSNLEEARSFFNRQDVSLNNKLSVFGSHASRQDGLQRLRSLASVYRPDTEEYCLVNFDEVWTLGHHFKDYVAPDGMNIKADHFEMDGKFGRVLYLRNYATYIRDSIVNELTALPIRLSLSIDILPTTTDEAIKTAEKKRTSVEQNIFNWERKQQRQGHFGVTLPYQMTQQRKEIDEFLSDLTERDQRMMFVCITIMHMADSKKQLDLDTKTLMSVAAANRCDLGYCRFQQLEGLQTVLPYGHRRLDILRTLTTEGVAAFMPFRAQDVSHKDGIYYGINAISKNVLFVDRREFINGNAWIIGASGSGKSFAAKREIAFHALKSDVDIIIIDPEREYGNLVKRLNGEVIVLAQDSSHRINALDVSLTYADPDKKMDPFLAKGQYVLSLVEMMMGSPMTPQERSIVDRCTRITYKDYKKSGMQGTVPTLDDLYRNILVQSEPLAREIALKIESHIKGSLDIFAKHTNVDVENKLICYDIHDLGAQLYPVGLFVVLDAILNRISKNRQTSRPTYVYIDEIYLLLAHQQAAAFLNVLWKRIRKYAGFMIGITQNISAVLDSILGAEMFGNSELQVILNQSPDDAARIVEQHRLSDSQAKFITNSAAGRGLLKAGPEFVPFVDEFPKDTELYRLMTTKAGEVS